MDAFFAQFTGNLKEIFAYITLRCNMKCLHCYLGEAKQEDMPLKEYTNIVQQLVKMGASKLTLLGGEPTLHPLFFKFITVAKKQGVNCVRVDTNGSFNAKILEKPVFKLADELSFSLEGANANTHQAVRPFSNYELLIKNIQKAIRLDYQTRVTMTVNSLNLNQIIPLVSQLSDLGVKSLNLHLISENGLAKQNQQLLVSAKCWIRTRQKLEKELLKFSNIEVKVPFRFIKGQINEQKKTITCEAVKNSRVLIMPNLKIYSCPLLLDVGRNFAYFKNGKFFYSTDYQNNIFSPKNVKGSACPILTAEHKQKYFQEDTYPVCVSYKYSNKNLCNI
ncbi:hypothetical protein COX24_03700 [bacterium (Candidatus Gribaldobacteria) CG23_combo_of_CG06-09_8_20_14_all_37_87_8]|uniref:Radical SAM core domain-containing protein n=1 Tax=bacterium (Candidatus Gribaldobacteria) CG23_combo_of_CG06-09_8_20_14_all_37_87_8 TaxID=2014278 RepID=A0A2G9ZE14_9BACT|nr:MAG: hypothetical protein AUJ25_00565 [Parcubacteria group bacterium CG1_02_37_13]PIP31422.1 MAG: hypothetical protein COX24_03700 [bacterium (Candidatus Gribaldobacteria) CG23_combo_of_CG06-09_8_20_14_all_37_87_8]